MLKLGFDISESTVLGYSPKEPNRTSGQHWKTFLRYHSAEIVSLDFLVVPTITCRLLYVLVFLSHDRRKIIHINVTDHPTSVWATHQLANAFYNGDTSKFLIRDRDKISGSAFMQSVLALGVRQILTTYRSPWQNGYIERVIGSIRRECLHHMVIVNETDRRGILQSFIHYYNTQRIHLGIGKDSPEPREVQGSGKTNKVAVANRLHHFYFRKAA